ncbi:MAG TPA: hypothetical protein VEF53_09645 [Patescibacteria group bacterium]|nr:hypothetical protein [Patescibacteria group bacterium]
MKKLLVAVTVLFFLAAGLISSLLYILGEKAIMGSIIELSKLELSTFESTDEEKAPETELDNSKVEAKDDEPVRIDIKDNNAPITTPKNETKQNKAAPLNSVPVYISQAHEKEDGTQELESVQEIKDKISMSETASLTKLLLSKLTKKDISELKGMLTNGVTSDEKERAKEILYSRLTTEDINKIKEAYIKYTQ